MPKSLPSKSYSARPFNKPIPTKLEKLVNLPFISENVLCSFMDRVIAISFVYFFPWERNELLKHPINYKYLVENESDLKEMSYVR